MAPLYHKCHICHHLRSDNDLQIDGLSLPDLHRCDPGYHNWQQPIRRQPSDHIKPIGLDQVLRSYPARFVVTIQAFILA